MILCKHIKPLITLIICNPASQRCKKHQKCCDKDIIGQINSGIEDDACKGYMVEWGYFSPECSLKFIFINFEKKH